MDCIFCEILAGRRGGHVIYEDAEHVAFLDKYPIDEGHSLVVPRKHHVRITDMEPDAVGRLFAAVPGVASAVLRGTGADAFSLAQNNGRAAKQIVPHVHVHIIPRYSGRGTDWTTRGIPDDAVLAGLASRIRGHVT